MPYLIDGHNLIPKMGLDLASFDDETLLLARLNEFSRLSRRGGLEVYFDNAQPGTPETRKTGAVIAHYVRKPLIADEAIRLRLKRLGRSAKNWQVVSSDHRVQNEARSVGAKVLSSEEFAATVQETLRTGDSSPSPAAKMSQSELEEWLHLFSGHHPQSGEGTKTR